MEVSQTALALTVTTALAGFVPARAWAHPIVDEAQRAYDDGDFQRTLALLETCAPRDDLTRAEFVRMLVLSAHAHHALSDEAALARDVRALATLESEIAWTVATPPAISAQFEQDRSELGGLIAVEATSRLEGQFIVIDARAIRDAVRLARGTRIWVRTEDGEWIAHDGSRASVPISHSRVLFYAELIGPGGAALAHAGSAAEPLAANTDVNAAVTPEVPAPSRAPQVANATPEPGTTVAPPPREMPWLAISIGAAVLTAGVAVLLFASGSDPSRTHIEDPEVEFGTRP